MTIKRKTDRLPRIRYGRRVEFGSGERETDVYDASTEQWAVATVDELEFVDEDDVELAEMDYRDLQQLAKERDIKANQSRNDLLEALEG